MPSTTLQYSLKKPRHWLWRTNFTREQIIAQLEDARITGDWLVCPLGEATHAVTVGTFVSNPDVFQPKTGSQHDTDEQARSQARQANLFQMFPLCVACFNFLAFPVIAASGPGGEVVAVVVAGVVCAEVGLVAAWSVLSSADFAQRLINSAAMGLLAYASLTIVVFPASGTDPEALLLLLVALAHCPLLLFAAQMPMWAARMWLQFEIVKDDAAASGSYLQPTKIKDLLVATAAIGVALAIVRIARLAADHAGLGPTELDQVFLFCACLCVGGFVASLLIVTPLAVVVLHIRSIVLVVTGVALWCGVISGLASLVFLVAALPLLHFFLLSVGGFTGATCAGLLLTRRAGYRLRVAGRPPCRE